MATIYLLDTGPLGLLAHDRPVHRIPIQSWLLQEMAAGATIYISEVADYEVRRELTRLVKGGQLPSSRLNRLDQLANMCIYLPVSTAMWRRTAELWADARAQGAPTAPATALDADVRTLMVLIVGAAVGLAALRNANGYWASATATVVVVAIATSVVGALPLHSRERSAWAGFAVFSGVYLVVAVGTVLSDRLKDYFGPTVALAYVQSMVSAAQSASTERQILLTHRQQLVAGQREADEEMGAALKWFDAEIQQADASLNSTDRWRSWLPGAVNTDDFRCVGHSLFALLAGLLGTVVARIFCARRTRSETQTP